MNRLVLLSLFLLITSTLSISEDEDEFKSALENALGNGGEVKLPVEKLLDLLRNSIQSPPNPNPVVSSLKIATKARKNHIDCEIDVEMLILGSKEQWRTIPVLSDSFAIQKHFFEGNDENTTLQAIKGRYTVLTKSTGKIRLHMEGTLPFTTTSRLGYKIPGLPLSLTNKLVLEDDGLITCSVDDCMTAENESCFFTPRQQLDVHCSPIRDEPDTKDQLLFNVEQATIHSVGEGMISTRSKLDLNVIQGSISTVLLNVTDRVVSVQGSMVKSFEQKDSILHVTLRNAVESNFQLMVNIETELGDDGVVNAPVIVTNGCGRERGHVLVDTFTNVEIETVAHNGLVPIDPSEFPGGFQQPVAAFKFLSHNRTLSLKVIRHSDAQVLVAVIDSAKVTIICTEEGRKLYKMTMQVRNTQKQFLEIDLDNATTWSALVDGASVKPATENGVIMVPMKKSSDAPFQIEMILAMKDGDVFTDRGHVTVRLPLVDIPINVLRVQLQVPNGFSYSDPMSPLNEVGHFPSTVTLEPPQPHRHMKMRAPHMEEQAWESNVMADAFDASAGSGLVKGVLPVKVGWPEFYGPTFLFENALFMDVEDNVSISIAYQKHYNAFWMHRFRGLPSWAINTLIVGVVTIVAVLVFVKRRNA